MMADSFDATTKMLMPHELGASGNASTVTIVGQHSIGAFNDLNHGTSFYHSATTASTTSSASGYNGFHSSTFHNYSHSLNGINSTTPTTTTSFNTLIHQQQPITLNNHHSITSLSAISSTMPPPLIPYHHHQSTPTTFYTTATSNTTNENVQQHQKSADVVQIKDEIKEEQHLETTDTNNELVGAEENEDAVEESDEPEIDIVISNVVCAFSVRCGLTLKDIALHGANVEYRRENGMVTMKLRKPYTTASIWSSGKITCTGATSEDQAKVAARRYARILQKLNFRVRFQNYRVVNVLGTCKMPWAIKIVQFSEKYKKEASYEPELHPGVTYNLKNPTATLKIFSTGSMTVTARSVANVQAAIEHIYPLVYEFKKPRTEDIQGDENIIADVVDSDLEEDDDSDDVNDDPSDNLVIDSSPPTKKQKINDVRDVSHLQKRYKGPPIKRRRGGGKTKRPLGKMNDPKHDIMHDISDGDIDGDDF